MNVLAISASLSRDSLNRHLVQTAADFAATSGVEVEFVDLRDLAVPFYSGDLETSGLPDGVARIMEGIRRADGLILASPEYNHAVSGAAKNLLDWVSRGRPYPLAGKPVLALTATPGRSGGLDALASIRRPLEAVGARVETAGFAHAARRPDGFVELRGGDAARLHRTVANWLVTVGQLETVAA